MSKDLGDSRPQRNMRAVLEYDEETGLHYNRFRYFDPDLDMFISRDPIGLMGGINTFQYAPNPTGWIDLFELSEGKNDCCRNKILSDLPSNIEEGKHIRGHNNFIEGKSYFYDDVSPQELLDGVHKSDFPIVSTGARGNPVVNFGKPIGVDANSGLHTQFGQIHYGKKGAHIVPHNPTLLE